MENENKRVGGYAAVNGLELYYEVHGTGEPLILLHGGFGMGSMFAGILSQLSQTQQVITVDLQGHGRTADIDRPLRYELMADDVAALIRHLGLGQVNVMGYSLGGGVALRTAIQHPDVVKKLVTVSAPFKRDAWYPEVLTGMGQMGREVAELMKQSPMYESYVSVAPQPENFPLLAEKTGDLLRQDYDWTDEVAALPMPTLVVFADADSVPPSHAARFYELLGGGQRDAGWDGSAIPASQLAILPGLTHYNIFFAPALVSAVLHFLNPPQPE